MFSIAEVEDYSKLTHDHNPLHFDLECATKAGYKDTPIPGLLVASLFPRIIASHFVSVSSSIAHDVIELIPRLIDDHCIPFLAGGDLREADAGV